MSETSKPSSLPTLPDTGRSTCSPGSAAGPTPCDSLAGPTTGPSGPEAVPVNRSVRRARCRPKKTRDTSGPNSDASSTASDTSPSGILQSCLESRLQAALDVNGSPEYVLTWKRWTMPSGPPICALRARARRTSDNAFTGWPTPTGQDNDQTAGEYSNPKSGTTLGGAARLAGWTTPAATDGERSGTMTPGMSGSSLTQQAPLAGWATPKVRDTHGVSTPEHHARKKAAGHGNSDLVDQVKLAGWATPATRDYRQPNATSYRDRGGASKGEQLSNQVVHSGPIIESSSAATPTSTAGTGRGGSVLNPQHSRWLQGLPDAWACCGATAMQSLPRSRRRSSGPTGKRKGKSDVIVNAQDAGDGPHRVSARFAAATTALDADGEIKRP